MAKTLLRSGNLDDFQAVGGGGQAVFESALQIREALRLRKQQAIVDCLAIPQVNDSGDRVDWYSPVEGSVTSWKAADEDDRYRALRYLENTLASVESLSKKCLQSPKTAQQLFGSLLSKAFQFPGENFLFLVDGKPVISFWGFVNLNENARDDVLDCLRESLVPEPAPVLIEDPEPEPEPEPVVAFEHADEPLIAPSTVVRITPEELYEPEPPRPLRNLFRNRLCRSSRKSAAFPCGRCRLPSRSLPPLPHRCCGQTSRLPLSPPLCPHLSP